METRTVISVPLMNHGSQPSSRLAPTHLRGTCQPGRLQDALQLCLIKQGSRSFSTVMVVQVGTLEPLCLGSGLRNYRIHNQTIMISSEGNEAEWTNRQHRLWISKWALQWKSIIRSSLGNTAYPYCLYIRSLYVRSHQSRFFCSTECMSGETWWSHPTMCNKSCNS